LLSQVGIDAGVASGDHGDSKSGLGTFNPLFPTGIYFGQGALALNGPTNLIEVGPHLSLQLAKSLAVVMDDHIFWRTSLQDGVYGLGINLLIAGQGILNATSAISRRSECTGMQPVIFRYPPLTDTFLSAHSLLKHHLQAKT
jgi:hypothetical protein